MKKKLALIYRLLSPILDPIKLLTSGPRYFSYLVDLLKYSRLRGTKLIDLYPIIDNKTQTTQIDPQYFYQGVWAFEKILKSKTKLHVDVGSQNNLVSYLTTITNIEFVDIRPLEANLKHFKSIKGSVLELPYKSNSVDSLSCLHVVEHVGLGRYGDPLDPNGTKKACKELKRVLSKKGNLYFSTPIGKERECFNAHRISSTEHLLKYFSGLKLVSFSAIDDVGNYIPNANISDFDNSVYSCGLFHFTK